MSLAWGEMKPRDPSDDAAGIVIGAIPLALLLFILILLVCIFGGNPE